MAEGGLEVRKWKALIIGGTGAAGKNVIGYLLKHSDKVDKVTVLGRRKLELTEEVLEMYGLSGSEEESGRLVQHVEDLDAVSEDTIKTLCTECDMYFCCIGTPLTLKFQYNFHVDCEIPDRIAQVAATAGVRHASLLTAQGANADSWFQMIRTKGEVEERFKKAGFDSVSVFRPGMLERGTDSLLAEKILRMILPSINVGNLAKAMVQDAFHSLSSPREESQTTKSTTFEVEDIKRVYEQSDL
jgi:hypothetical protein